MSTLQLLVSKAQAIFDLYRALAALEQLVDHVRDCKDERAKRCSIILCQCRPLLNIPAMQSVLIKLVADKEEAELAQVSLFLSEKISFWNSRLYDRETTLDIFEVGRGGDDSTIPGYGNPATSRVVKDYLAAMRVEQLEARIVPTQADPFFISDPAAIAAFIGKRVNESDLSANQPFKLIRDQAFLKTLFFAGDRASDLGKVKTQELLHFPRREDLLFNHVLTKSPRDGTSNLFSLKR